MRGTDRGRWHTALPIPCLFLAAAAPAAAQTRPATAIVNVAAARTDDGTATSNGVTLSVAERLDVALDRASAVDAVLASGERALGVLLTNRGTGDEAFLVAPDGAPGARVVPGGAPSAPLAGARTPSLAPGESLSLLVVVPAGAAATVSLSARAATGSGAPGTSFAGRGDGGSDAVVGASGAAATLALPLGAGEIAATLEKSQAVLAPDGSAAPVRGAVVTYTLVARLGTAGAAADLVDPIPAGTVFVPGSLVLDGVPLADAGHLAGGAVAVPLGAVAAGTVRTLRFQVVIS